MFPECCGADILHGLPLDKEGKEVSNIPKSRRYNDDSDYRDDNGVFLTVLNTTTQKRVGEELVTQGWTKRATYKYGKQNFALYSRPRAM